MSLISGMYEVSAENAKMESLANNPYAAELVEIMEDIKKACAAGYFQIVLPKLHKTNFRKLESLGYTIEESSIKKEWIIKW